MKKNYKKMTQKEFKEAFEAAGFSFDIWGWEGVLNLISICEKYTAENNEKIGLHAAAQHAFERHAAINDTLRKRGYFEEAGA